MNISFAALALPKTGTLVLTVTDKGGLGPLGKELNEETGGGLKRAMAAANFTGAKGSTTQILAPGGSKIGKVILAGLGKPAQVKEGDLETLGAKIANKLLSSDKAALLALDTHKGVKGEAADNAARIAFGARLGAYRFGRYHTTGKGSEKPKLTKITMLTEATAKARSAFKALDALADGVYTARDLVNEPGNVVYPKSFAARCRKLSQDGVKVSVLGEKQMKDLGMGALLGVGQGSVRESQMVIMEWKGGKAGEAPVAFVGKGVTFDSGGISLKPGASMEDMKGDMGGAAAVAGVMTSLAKRKAKVNVVGVIGLVENMPDAAAQRPGDIVKSMSGQTIEIVNTDAEGRLVLADALWHTQKKYKPKCMIDLATLTGAIIVSLGQENAGLFTNDDTLAKQLTDAGLKSREPVWRLPLGDGYDKQINSRFADMKNTGGRFGGSITAAQFLQRFTNKVPWVHLDIAGMAWGPTGAVYPGWATGFGVRLLDRWVSLYHE